MESPSLLDHTTFFLGLLASPRVMDAETVLLLLLLLDFNVTDSLFFSSIMKGSRGELFTKQGGNWKKYYTKLTHDTLFLFKNRLDDNKKAKLKFLFQHATDVDTIDEEGKIDSVTPYTFSIAFGAVTKYFCAMNSEKMKEWVDNLTARIKGKTSHLSPLPNPSTKRRSYLGLNDPVTSLPFPLLLCVFFPKQNGLPLEAFILCVDFHTSWMMELHR